MDKIKQDFLNALQDAVDEAGSQTRLAEKTGMHQSRISDYLSGRYKFDNITIGTLRKLFPEIMILFNARWKHSSDLEEEMEKMFLSFFRQLPPAEKIQFIIALSDKIRKR